MPEITSQWFPYTNTQTSYNNFSQGLNIPKIVCDYLLDAPNPNYGYKPIDDNNYARCRFWKYVYYDTEKPLEKVLPTIKQKKQVLFNPDKPEEPPTDKGYRLIPQVWVKQAQTEGQTRVFVYCGSVEPRNEFNKMHMAIRFRILTHYTYETNTKTSEAYNRTLAIEQALIEAFVGVNMTGVGTFMYSKQAHSACGSREIYDGDTNVGRELTLAIELATTAVNDLGRTDNMMSLGRTGGTKLV